METENKKPNNDFHQFLTSIYFKIGLVFLIFILLMIPKIMIEEIIEERKSLRDEAIQEVSEKWGNNQVIQAGLVTIPYIYKKENITFEDTTYQEFKRTLHLLPTSLKINGEIIPKEKYRGIYRVPLYQTKMHIECRYDPIDLVELDLKDKTILWDKATFSTGVNDLTGVNENIEIVHGNEKHKLKPLDSKKSPLKSGLQTPINFPGTSNNTIVFDMSVNGSEQIEFAPLGQETEVTLSSKWNDPSFLGDFLPDSKEISSDGFTATWKIQEINRSIPQHWVNESVDLGEANFGVSLFIPVDHYQKSMRSVKYAVLTIILTFCFFVFIEILQLRKLHIIQFVLVGLSLVLFYSLLVSLSEHISFDLSYWVAAGATIVLNVIYTIPTLKSTKLTIILGLTLSGLYGFVFFLLQLENYALLVGNIGLFIILSVIMLATRKIKWSKNS